MQNVFFSQKFPARETEMHKKNYKKERSFVKFVISFFI